MSGQRRWGTLWRDLAATALVLAITACGGDSDAPPAAPPVVPPAATGSVSGTVVASATGLALAGVAITSDSRSTSSAADGSYTLTDVPAGAARVLAFERAGHAKSVLVVAVSAGITARANARLTPIGAAQSFDAAAGATVTVAGSTAQVSLPAAGLVTTTGVAATGLVTAELTPINPATDPANMPGNYTAQAAVAGGAAQPIESFGALNVTLKDAAGKPLNLAPGKTATIRIPLATRSVSPPAAVPLFYFDEATGLWVKQGSATLAGSAPNQYYEGTVSHFTTWNADQVIDTISVMGCVQDAAGANIAAAEVNSYGADYSGRASTASNANCAFAVAIRKGSVAIIVAQVGNHSSAPKRVGPSQTNIVLGGALVLNAGGAPPLIVEQPQSTTAPLDYFARFYVTAVDPSELRYQWQRNGVDIAGETTTYLTIHPTLISDNGARFKAIVINAYGSATSDEAVLTINTVPQPPRITGQPLPKSVLVGASADFEVSFVAQGGTLSAQWLRNGTPIPGATGSRYIIAATVAADNGSVFSVLVSSSNGTSVASNGALLTVGVPTPLVITNPPQNTSVSVGQSASFSVSVTGGAAAPTFQWRRNGANIVGANAVSYTTPATTLADNGANYSVVVASGAETLTSGNATLTVTPQVAGNGYYLLASAGPTVLIDITFANGLQSVPSQVLLAVNAASPGSVPLTMEPVAQTRFLFSSVVEGTVNAGQVSNLRSRIGTYFKGGRLYKIDQVVANGAAPVPQVVSTLLTTQVCGEGGMAASPTYAQGNDLSNPPHGWMFLRGPGADGLCNSADDNHWAVRLDMLGTDPARTVPGEPQVDFNTANGAFAGVVLRVGNEMRRTDADLNMANSVLFNIDAASYINLGRAFGSSLPGIWLFIEGGKLWGVNLGAPATRVELATLTAGESITPLIAGDGASAFVGLSTSTSARVLRVNESLSNTATVATLNQPLANLAMSLTRVVMLTQGSPASLLSVAKAGGPTTSLLSLGAGVIAGQLLASGENVYLAQYQFGANGSSVSTFVVGADGANPVTLASTDIKRSVAPATQPLAFGFENTYAVLLADGVTGPTSNAGATLRAVNGATRATLVTYGSLPASPDGLVASITGDPLQYGQPGLFTFISLASGDGDLYFFKSDATGLIRVTNFSPAAPAQAVRVGAQRVPILPTKRDAAVR